MCPCSQCRPLRREAICVAGQVSPRAPASSARCSGRHQPSRRRSAGLPRRGRRFRHHDCSCPGGARSRTSDRASRSIAVRGRLERGSSGGRSQTLIELKGGGLFAFAGFGNGGKAERGRSESAPSSRPSPTPDGANPQSDAGDCRFWRLWPMARRELTGARELLRPCPGDWLEAYPVSPRVNRPQNDDAGPVEPDLRVSCGIGGPRQGAHAAPLCSLYVLPTLIGMLTSKTTMTTSSTRCAVPWSIVGAG